MKSMSLDDFLQDWSNDEDDTTTSGDSKEELQDSLENSEVEEEEEAEADSGDSEDQDSSEEEADRPQGARQQKKYLSNLKDTDPEFYQFLEENDQELLNFDESSSSEDEDGEEKAVEKLHKPPESLEVASDDSDFELEDDDDGVTASGKSGRLTKSMIDNWSQRLDKSPSIGLVSELVLAFRAAIETMGGGQQDQDQDGKKKKGSSKTMASKYRVNAAGGMFNALTKVCLTKMEPALAKLLQVDTKKPEPQNSKKWRPLNKWIKAYTGDVSKLLSSLSEPSVISALLKHIHGLVPYYNQIPKSAKMLLKTLIKLWSTHTEESVRVLAFMVIIKLVRGSTKTDSEDDGLALLETGLKGMYMAYIRNAKFTSPNTWPMINFMRRSLSEVFLLDPALAYRHSFIYIRQLTIHLRNAIMHSNESSGGSLVDGSKKKKAKSKSENPLQAVYNWQFLHAINLFVQILGDSHPNAVLEPLIYPLVQLMTGTIKLNYSAKHYPLRFHLCKMLIQLSTRVAKFVPILPYYLDILASPGLQGGGKKSGKHSMKPMDFSCVIKLSKSQLSETAFKDSTVDHVYSGLMECLASLSNKICFPELVVPASAQLRNYLKKCKIPNYSRKLKTVLDKVTENSKFILEERSKVSFGVRDLDDIRTWEAQIMVTKTPPLAKWFDEFKGAKEAEQKKKKQQELDDYKFVPKMKIKSKDNADKKDGEFKGIFGGEEDSDSDDMDDVERFELKEDRGKKRKQEAIVESDSSSDVDESVDEPEAKLSRKDESDESSEGDGDDQEDIVEDFAFSDEEENQSDDESS